MELTISKSIRINGLIHFVLNALFDVRKINVRGCQHLDYRIPVSYTFEPRRLLARDNQEGISGVLFIMSKDIDLSFTVCGYG